MSGSPGHALYEQEISGHLSILAKICNMPLRRRVLVQGQGAEVHKEGLPSEVAGL